MDLTLEDIEAMRRAIDRGLFDSGKAAMCLYRHGREWHLSAQPYARVHRSGFSFTAPTLAEVIGKALPAAEQLNLI